MAQGQGHRLCPAASAQFFQDVTDVGFGSGTADDEPLGDFGIVQPFHQQGQHFHFALGEAEVGGVGGRLPGRVQQRLHCFRGQGGLAAVGGPDGRGQLVGGNVFQQVAHCPSLHHLADLRRLVKTGEGNDLDVGPALADLAGGGHAIHDGHDQVHQHNVWL